MFINGTFQACLHISLLQNNCLQGMQKINTSYIGSIVKRLNLAVQLPKNCIVLWKTTQKLSQSLNCSILCFLALIPWSIGKNAVDCVGRTYTDTYICWRDKSRKCRFFFLIMHPLEEAAFFLCMSGKYILAMMVILALQDTVTLGAYLLKQSLCIPTFYKREPKASDPQRTNYCVLLFCCYSSSKS